MSGSGRKKALITGATSGIGAAFAKRLARDGFDLILHGRRRERLETLALALEKAHGITTKVMIAELSRTEELRSIENYIQELDQLDMLVNNAGYWTPANFWERDPNSEEAMIRVHVVAPVRFARAALPGMLKRNKGGIINVSGAAAYVATARSENYGGTKAYLIAFTEALHVALIGTGLRVQALVPAYTLTEFYSRFGVDPTKVHSKWIKWMTPEEVVDTSLKALEKDKVVCIPGLWNRTLLRIVRSLPRSVYYRTMRTMRTVDEP
jgi:short-subunit dehydrogenase